MESSSMLKNNTLSPIGVYSKNARIVQYQEFHKYDLLYNHYKEKKNYITKSLGLKSQLKYSKTFLIKALSIIIIPQPNAASCLNSAKVFKMRKNCDEDRMPLPLINIEIAVLSHVTKKERKGYKN